MICWIFLLQISALLCLYARLTADCSRKLFSHSRLLKVEPKWTSVIKGWFPLSLQPKARQRLQDFHLVCNPKRDIHVRRQLHWNFFSIHCILTLFRRKWKLALQSRCTVKGYPWSADIDLKLSRKNYVRQLISKIK